MGATGCRQYVTYFVSVPLSCSKPAFPGAPGSLHFETQIPHDTNLLGMSIFVQFADDERGLSPRTNNAELTTSNGLELKVSGVSPGLGMSIVTSRTVRGMTPFPAEGIVDVSMGPVLRILH